MLCAQAWIDKLCVEPAGASRRCMGVSVPLRFVPSPTGLPSKRCPGIGFSSSADREIGVFHAWRISWTEEPGEGPKELDATEAAKHLPGALCSGTGSPALGLCSPQPKRTGEGPKPHPHDSTLGESSREAQSGRRLLGTNGGSLWLWCCLPQPGALGP